MQAIKLITEPLERAHIPYCIVGGLAAIAYGRPRLTLDADLVISLSAATIPDFLRAFPEAEFYLPPVEVLLAEISRESRGHFNILHQSSALRADCYLPGTNVLSRWELQNRRQLSTPEGAFWFAPPETVIVNKLLFFREGQSQKHLADIRGILSATTLNESQLQQWIHELNLRAEWQAVEARD